MGPRGFLPFFLAQVIFFKLHRACRWRSLRYPSRAAGCLFGIASQGHRLPPICHAGSDISSREEGAAGSGPCSAAPAAGAAELGGEEETSLEPSDHMLHSSRGNAAITPPKKQLT